MQAEERTMRAMLPPLAGRSVLDLACGTGRYALIAREAGARRVVAVDNSAAMLLASPVSQRAQATCEAVPLPAESCDVVICALALGHLPRLAPSLGEIARVLRPGGCALVSDFHPFIFLSGARRTFESDGVTYAVEHYAHLYSDYHTAALDAGLRIAQVAEPILDGARGVPVVLVMRFEKRKTS
jgi:malonyl-CoA O-methyltransferase